MIIPITREQVPYDSRIRGLCKVPYNDNPTGCPNFGKKEGCPPLPYFPETMREDGELFLIYTAFPIGRFIERNVQRGVGSERREYPDYAGKGIAVARTIEEALRREHPEWPDEYFPKKPESWEGYQRIASQMRWWQPTARAMQKKEEEKFKERHPGLIVDSSPEARGVNLTGLMANAGIILDWRWPPPADCLETLTYRISLGGSPISLDSRK